MSIVVQGDRISELQKIYNFSNDTKFLIARIENESRKVLKSYNLNYDILSDQILYDVSSILSLGSMSHESKYNYSKITHKHDYSHVEAKVFYGPNSEMSDIPFDMVNIGVIEISNYNKIDTLSICVPDIKYEPPQTYRIGELKMIYISSYNVVEELEEKGYTKSKGWVVPDGSTYSKTEFPRAYELYKDSTSTTSFKVPSISGFFRLNPGIVKTLSLKQMPYRNSDINHIHQIHQPVKLGHVDMSVEFDLSSTLYWGTDVACHCGNPESTIFPIEEGCSLTGVVDLDTDVTVMGTGMTVKSVEGTDSESYPTHDTIAIMLYLGEDL